MSKRYVVTNTILSRDEGATPADVTYYRGEDPVQAINAMVSAFTLRGDDPALPERMKFDVTGIRVAVHEVEPEPVEEEQTYTLAQIRNGTGFRRGTRFVEVGPVEAEPS